MIKSVQNKKKPCVARISVSFTKEEYSGINEFAQNKHVSLAWVIREAVRNFLIKKDGYDNKF